ncbi:hypothetical protein HmCmsJML022_03981 [Escherichia coli]|nr:hypothetical protein HmCmsJML022_03981 [Escherichia coli]
MKGACVGACLFEGWAKDAAQALAILEQGEVNFMPCHHVNAVGPMGGITSASMPMLDAEYVTDGSPHFVYTHLRNPAPRGNPMKQISE